ncbi:signal peptidase I [Calidifontibacter terrae]
MSQDEHTRAISLQRVRDARRAARKQEPVRLPEPPDENRTSSMSRAQLDAIVGRTRSKQVGKLPQPRKRKGSLLRELGIVVAVALVLSILIKTFLAQPFWIPSGSMENTLVRGDRVIVGKLTPGPLALHRGDVVVFEDTGHWLEEPNVKRSTLSSIVVRPLQFVGLYPEGDNHLIKRVIGLPGDHVTCHPGSKLTINDIAIDEPYLYPGDQPCDGAFNIRVPDGKVWVMGDHRSDSGDSRFHDNDSGGADGSVPMSSITGRAVAIAWPMDRMGWLSNYSTTFDKVPNA